MMRRVLLLTVALALIVPAAAQDSYKTTLVSHYPFYKTVTTSFAPIYPALAQQIVDDFGITEGICVDVGGGSGALSFALAKQTDMTFYVLDIDPWAVRLCNYLAMQKNIMDRVRAVQGDAQDMPFRDDYADLVVSRGSIFFWPDQLAGVTECYRILKPGGVAYVGGGFSRILDPAIREPLARAKQQSLVEHREGGWRPMEQDLVERAKAAGIEDIHMEAEPIAGWWLVIRKPAED
ncbi:MAG: class I SAM-dependent methyltransferase [Armatimonadota bacterium]